MYGILNAVCERIYTILTLYTNQSVIDIIFLHGFCQLYGVDHLLSIPGRLHSNA